MRETVGVGAHESKPQREIWAAEIWSLAHREFFRPRERVQPARQNVCSEKRSMMELPGPPKGQVIKALQRRRKLARGGGRETQSRGERISEGRMVTVPNAAKRSIKSKTKRSSQQLIPPPTGGFDFTVMFFQLLWAQFRSPLEQCRHHSLQEALFVYFSSLFARFHVCLRNQAVSLNRGRDAAAPHSTQHSTYFTANGCANTN